MSDDFNPIDIFSGGVTATTRAAKDVSKKAGEEVGEAMAPELPGTPQQKTAPVPDDEQRRVAIQRFLARRSAGAGREGTKLSSGTLG